MKMWQINMRLSGKYSSNEISHDPACCFFEREITLVP